MKLDTQLFNNLWLVGQWHDGEFRAIAPAVGYEPFPQTREQFTQTIQAESTRFAEIIKRSKISLD